MSNGTGSPLGLGLDHLTGIRVLGSGGFGAVYAATDTDLDRPVAVKVFHDLRDPTDLARFDRERKAMGRLTGHPNIVTLYHTGYTAHGQPYLLMELIDGGSLGDRLKARGPLPWPEAVDHAAAVARALAHAHQRGVLHRDVKPANILIDGGLAKLADFGIARLTDTDRTASGTLLASLAHAAPETFSDRRDERSDVYSLGSTLFHLIAGRPPFHRDGDESQMALLHRVVHEPPPLLGPTLAPPELDQLLQRALAKDPALRPATAMGLADELDRCAAATGGEPTRPWLPTPSANATQVWPPDGPSTPPPSGGTQQPASAPERGHRRPHGVTVVPGHRRRCRHRYDRSRRYHGPGDPHRARRRRHVGGLAPRRPAGLVEPGPHRPVVGPGRSRHRARGVHPAHRRGVGRDGAGRRPPGQRQLGRHRDRVGPASSRRAGHCPHPPGPGVGRGRAARRAPAHRHR